MTTLNTLIADLAAEVESMRRSNARLVNAARPIAQRELAKVRAEYSATFPAGVRFTWGTA